MNENGEEQTKKKNNNNNNNINKQSYVDCCYCLILIFLINLEDNNFTHSCADYNIQIGT